MNYIKIYNSIIENAQIIIREEYTEIHHIIPKCMGGTDSVDNLVRLTAREHYICHWLLAKYYNNKKLWAAFSMMNVKSEKHDRITNSKTYHRARKSMSIAMSGEGNPMYGKPSACKSHTQETKDKIRNSKLGKKRNPFTRSPHTEETRKRISEANKGKIPHNKGKERDKTPCLFCGKLVDSLNMKRWHGENCKLKNA